jgi:hypothetical protein
MCFATSSGSWKFLFSKKGLKDRGRRSEGGGGEWEPNQILLQEPTYVPRSNLKAKPYKKVMNTLTNSVEMIPSKT